MKKLIITFTILADIFLFATYVLIQDKELLQQETCALGYLTLTIIVYNILVFVNRKKLSN